MRSILLFGGTLEGRLLFEKLGRAAVSRSVQLICCVTTAYGRDLLPQLPNCTVLTGPQPAEKIKQLILEQNVCVVVDATHPYALHISTTLQQVCGELRRPLVRCLRAVDTALPEHCLTAADAEEAAALCARLEGNILITTGSKHLNAFSALGGQRLYARVLPNAAGLAACENAGIPASHIIALQGPFTKELNEALMRQFAIKILVTKNAGAAGGYKEKLETAEACGAVCVVLEAPAEENGYCIEDTAAQVFALLEKGEETDV